MTNRKISGTFSLNGVRLLNNAINEAAGWSGSLVGDPDPTPLRRFDKKIVRYRAAISRAYEAAKKLDDEAKKAAEQRAMQEEQAKATMASQSQSMAQYYTKHPA